MSFLEKSGEWTISRKMSRQKEQEDQTEKNKRGDRKGESNDSPEIPDRRITSDIPGLPSGQKTLSSNKKFEIFVEIKVRRMDH